MTRVIISDCGKRFIIVRWLKCLPRLKRKEEDKAVKFLVKYWRKGQRNKLELAFLGYCLKRGVSYESARRIIGHVCDLTCDEEKAGEYHVKVATTKEEIT